MEGPNKNPREIVQSILTQNFTRSKTLEDFVERALVHLIRWNSLDESYALLSSDETAELITDAILVELEVNSSLASDVCVVATDDEIDQYIDSALVYYDGFSKDKLLYQQFHELLQLAPHASTLKRIKNKRCQIAKKFKKLLAYIVERRRKRGQATSVQAFLTDLSSDEGLRAIESGEKSDSTVLGELIVTLRDRLDFVFCGEGGRLKAYRLRVKKEGRVRNGVEWEFEDLILKRMKKPDSGRSVGQFFKYKKEHEIVASHFPGHVPATHFLKLGRPIRNGEGVESRFFVAQEFVNGVNILAACLDPFLAAQLQMRLSTYLDRYLAMQRETGFTIDCSSTAKRNVLVRRRLIGSQDVLGVDVVDTNNLIPVDSARFRKLYIDRKTGEQHYVASLRDFIKSLALTTTNEELSD